MTDEAGDRKYRVEGALIRGFPSSIEEKDVGSSSALPEVR